MTGNQEKARAIFLTVVMVLSMVGSGIAFSGGAAAQTADIIVSADGSTNYASIQNAVNNATVGDVIEVESGTYREEVTVNKNIELVAGSGDVILNGSTLSSGADGIDITTGSTVGPTINGFTITGYEDAVDARNTAGDWTLVNTTVDDTVFGISAFESTGNWTIQNATVTGGSFGVDASVSSGEWKIANTTVRNASNAGIAAEDGTGNGTVYNTIVTNSSTGIELYFSDGDVTITESTFTNNSIGVSAKSTTGELAIEESRIYNNSVEGLNATGATIDGNALYNYWGAPDGPSGLFGGSGDAVFGEVEISPYYTDEALTDLAGVRVDANPVVNTTVSSVTPSAVGINETAEYTVTMTIENTTLTDESGDVDVAFENFTLETFDNDLTIDYTSSDISNGTLSVTGSVNATAPTVTGTYAVNLTEIRVDGPLEGPVENGNMTIDTVEVGAAADPVVDKNASTVTPTIASPSTSQEYKVNVTIALNESLSDSSGGVDVQFEDFVFDNGEDDLTIDYTAANITNGTLNVTKTVNATAPSTAGERAVNVTELRVEDTTDPLIANANITIDRISVSDKEWRSERITYGFLSSIEIDDGDTPHISYYDGSDLSYVTRKNGEWQSEKIVVDDPDVSFPRFSSIALNTNSSPQFIYNGGFRRLTSAGWESVGGVGGEGTAISINNSTSSPSVAYAQSGTIYHAELSADTWQTTSVAETSATRASVGIAVDNQNQTHIAYVNPDDETVVHASRSAGSWQTTVIDNASGGQWADGVSIAVTPSDSIQIAYIHSSGEPRVAENNGSGWQRENVDEQTKSVKAISLEIDDNGTSHVAYGQSYDGDVRYASRDSNSTWIPQTVSNSMGDSGISIALNSSGSPRIVYEGSNANGDLMYATTEDPDLTEANLTWSGSGTQTDPYIVTNVSQLQDIRHELEAHYELGNDINASETAEWNDGKGFDPIGTGPRQGADRFTGSFDGENHTIAELTIQRPQEDGVGLFSGVESGNITDTELDAINISGQEYVGGVAGWNEANITNVSVSGHVSGAEKVGGAIGRHDGDVLVQNTISTSSVNGSRHVGGLIGRSWGGTVKSSSASGSVSGSESASGGLIGYIASGNYANISASGSVDGSFRTGGLVGTNANGYIENASATGEVNGSDDVGGLVGWNGQYINESYATGNVNGSENVGGLIGTDHWRTFESFASGTVTGDTSVGGLVGTNGNDVTYSQDRSLRRSYATGDVTGNSEVGGLIGISLVSGVVSDSYATGEVSGSYTVGGLIGKSDAPVSSSYWDEESTGQISSDGGTGLTTSQMIGAEAETNMNGLDFTETWETQPNSYPALRWEDTSTGDSSASLNGGDETTLDGTNTTVRFELANTGETNNSYILNLSLPEGWTAVDYDNDGGDRQDGEAKWLWQTITPNETVAPSVTLEVPKNTEGTYTVSGDALSNDSIVAQADATVTVFDGNLNASLDEQTIGNGSETAITVEAPQSDGSFVDVTDQAVYASNNTDVATVDANGTVTAKSTGTATLNVSYDNRVANVTITVEPATVEEAVDGNNNNQIDDVEILQAITYWQDNDTVPRTDGDTIGDFEILNLIEQWRYNTEL